MSQQLLSPHARELEFQLEQPGDSHGKQRIRDVAGHSLAAQRLPPGLYDVYAVRMSPEPDIFAQKNVHLGTYSEADLYGSGGSQLVAFKGELGALRVRAERIISLDAGDIEYVHQSTLFWADAGRLKNFLGVSPVVTELVAEIRTARFQFLRRDTPKAVFQAMGSALKSVVDSPRWDTGTVDQFVSILETGGVDPLAIDSLRDAHA